MTTNPHKGRTGLDRLLHAAGYSLEGLILAFRSESAFRQEALLALFMLPLAGWVGQGWIEVVMLAGSVLLVMIVELLNSAVEATVDRVSFEIHDLSKRAKDFGSAAVFLSALLCLMVWAGAAVHSWPRLWNDLLGLASKLVN